jgi:chlorobactene glucosyltransferase
MAYASLVIVCIGTIVWFWLLVRLRTNWRSVLKPLPARSVPPPAPRVSIVIPARNEERELARTLESLAAQDYPDFQVIVVNDGSSDSTGEIAASWAERDRQFLTINAPPPPDGWLGKCRALHLGASVAKGKWIVFADADVRHSPGCISRTVAVAEEQGLDFLTITPKLEAEGIWEQITIPPAFFVGLATLPMRKVMDPKSDLALGAGAFNLVRASAYREVGGHEPVRMAVIDDMMLGVLFKVSGKKVDWADGRELIRVRMYDSASAIVSGLRKNAYAASLTNPAAVWAGPFLLAAAFVLPLPVAAYSLMWGSGLAWTLAGLLGAGLYLSASLILPLRGALAEHRTGWGFAHPLGMCVLMIAGCLSAFDAVFRSQVRWRGRVYTVAPKGIGRGALLFPERK